jgi:uncharacterized membrane protein YhaH (DUF805 family)
MLLYTVGKMSGLIGYTLVVVATFVPGLAMGARRLHDIGRSGWWQLIGLIPIVGILVLLYLWVLESEGLNQYGCAEEGGYPSQTAANRSD